MSDPIQKPEETDALVEATSSEQKVLDGIATQEVTAENVNEVFIVQSSFGDRLSDQIAAFGGSWRFILLFLGFIFVWISLNSLMFLGVEQFDPYPFILLNLGLSSLAAFQAPIIMMSQNRQSEKDRLKVEENYAVSLKTDMQIIDMQKKLDELNELLTQVSNTVNRKHD